MVTTSNSKHKKTKVVEKLIFKNKKKSNADEIFTQGIKNLIVLKPMKGGNYEEFCGK